MTLSDLELYFILFSCIILFVSFAVFGLYLFRKNITNIKENIIEKHRMQSQFEQELLQTQLEIQEQTLKNISEEIHDNVGQVLSLAKLNLNTFEHNPEKKLQSTKDLVSKAINDLRNLSRSLHGDKIAETGLQEAIRHELQILQNTGQYETNLQISGEPYKLEPQQEMVLFRIVQEALHNSVKHALGSRMEVALDYAPGRFSLTVRDDGTGFRENSLEVTETGIGLKSMKNRAAMIGAVLSILTGENKGTCIAVELAISTLKPQTSNT